MKDLGTILTNGKQKIVMTNIDGYKKPCLCIFKSPNTFVKVASFNGVNEGILFMEYLSEMVGAKREEDADN